MNRLTNWKLFALACLWSAGLGCAMRQPVSDLKTLPVSSFATIAGQVNALQSALHLANLRYKGGLANYLDVLIAQRNLFDAELSLAATRRLHLVSVVQLTRP